MLSQMQGEDVSRGVPIVRALCSRVQVLRLHWRLSLLTCRSENLSKRAAVNPTSQKRDVGHPLILSC
jgi:hypothetical protein